MTHEIADCSSRCCRRARRGGLPRGAPPLHADARRARARADDPDDGLPRRVRADPACAAEFFDAGGDRSARAMTATAARASPSDAASASRRPRHRAHRARLRIRHGAVGGARPRRQRCRHQLRWRSLRRPLAIPLRTDRPTLVANFVSTLDGVVAFVASGASRRARISGGFGARPVRDGPAARARRTPSWSARAPSARARREHWTPRGPPGPRPRHSPAGGGSWASRTAARRPSSSPLRATSTGRLRHRATRTSPVIIVSTDRGRRAGLRGLPRPRASVEIVDAR